MFNQIKKTLNLSFKYWKHPVLLVLSYLAIELCTRPMIEIENAGFGAQYFIVYNILLVVVTVFLVIGTNSVFQLYFMGKELVKQSLYTVTEDKD